MSKAHLVWVVLLAVVLAVPAEAEEEALQPAKQVVILAKVINFDQDLSKRAGQVLTIGVVYKSQDDVSAEDGSVMLSAFSGLKDKQIQGLSVDVVELDFVDAAQFESDVEEKSVDVLYVSARMYTELEPIIAVSQARDLITIAGVGEYVRLGVSVGAVLDSGKPKILLNLKSSQAEGMSLKPELLRLVTVIK